MTNKSLDNILAVVVHAKEYDGSMTCDEAAELIRKAFKAGRRSVGKVIFTGYIHAYQDTPRWATLTRSIGFNRSSRTDVKVEVRYASK